MSLRSWAVVASGLAVVFLVGIRLADGKGATSVEAPRTERAPTQPVEGPRDGRPGQWRLEMRTVWEQGGVAAPPAVRVTEEASCSLRREPDGWHVEERRSRSTCDPALAGVAGEQRAAPLAPGSGGAPEALDLGAALLAGFAGRLAPGAALRREAVLELAGRPLPVVERWRVVEVREGEARLALEASGELRVAEAGVVLEASVAAELRVGVGDLCVRELEHRVRCVARGGAGEDAESQVRTSLRLTPVR